MATNNFILLNRTEYFTQLIRLADKTKRGDRIALASMTFDPSEPLIANVMRALCEAASRGVNVDLAIDAHTFLIRDKSIVPGPLWFHASLPAQLSEPYRTWFASLEALKNNGGRYAITNVPARPFSSPFAGRSHIKTAVINNFVFIGGCNLQDPTHIDIMVAWQDQKAADWTYHWVKEMVATGSTRQTFAGKDRALTLSPEMQLLIDAGVPKQSIIYDRAMQLIDEAQEHIFFTCQFFPGGSTADHLLEAYKRGVDVRIIYSPPHAHGQKALGHWLYNSRERLRLPPDFFTEQRAADAPLLHAKVIATEKGAIVGSNNYVSQGVWLGTAEIALLNRNPAFAQALTRKIIATL